MLSVCSLVTVRLSVQLCTFVTYRSKQTKQNKQQWLHRSCDRFQSLWCSLYILLVAGVVAIDEAEHDHRLVGALEGRHPRGASALGLHELAGFAT